MTDRHRWIYTLVGMLCLMLTVPIGGRRYHAQSDRPQGDTRTVAVSSGRSIPVQPSYRPTRGQTRFVARALSVAYLRYTDCVDEACRRQERAVIRQRLQELLEYERRDERLRRLCRQLLTRWDESLLQELMSYLYEATRFGGAP